MFVLFVVLALALHYALTSTKWGKAVYAVGGTSRRAPGPHQCAARLCVRLAICTTLAAFGGVLGAARLAAANQASGGGDVNLNAIAAAVIGGTSLFGGRGTAFAAVLGVAGHPVDLERIDVAQPRLVRTASSSPESVLLLAVGVRLIGPPQPHDARPRLSGRGPGVAGDTGSMVRTYVCPGPRR